MVHEGVAIAEEDVRDSLLLGDLPDALLIVEVGRVLRKPHDPDMLPDVPVSQEGSGLLRRVNRPVVQHQDDPFPRSSGAKQESANEEKELCAVLPTLNHTGNQRTVLARGVVERSEGGNLAVLPRRRDLHLPSPSHPSPGQVRVKMEVGFIFEPEFVSGARAKSPFFRA